MSEVEIVEIPDTLPELSAEQMDDITRPPALKLGTWFRGQITALKGNKGRVITQVNEETGKGGNYQLAFQINVTDENGNVKTPSVQHRLTLPYPNAEVPGHVAPNTFGLCKAFLYAVGLVDTQTVTKVARGQYVDADGIPMSEEDVRAHFDTEKLKVFAAIKDAWKDPESLVGASLFFKLKQNGDYVNIDRVAAESPADEDVAFENFVA